MIAVVLERRDTASKCGQHNKEHTGRRTRAIQAKVAAEAELADRLPVEPNDSVSHVEIEVTSDSLGPV